MPVGRELRVTVNPHRSRSGPPKTLAVTVAAVLKSDSAWDHDRS